MKYLITITFDDNTVGSGYAEVDAQGNGVDYMLTTEFGPVVPGVTYADALPLSFAKVQEGYLYFRRGTDYTPSLPFGGDYQELRIPLGATPGSVYEYFVEDNTTVKLQRNGLDATVILDPPTQVVPLMSPVFLLGTGLILMFCALYRLRAK